MEKWTDENIRKIEKFIDIRNRGYHCSGQQVTDVYNEVLGKNVPSTNCSSCVRQRIDELAKALNKFKDAMSKAAEAEKIEEVENVSTKEEKTAEKPSDEPKKVTRRRKK